MWSLKAHYFLWFGSLSGILPYVSVFARTHLGVSASAVGILYCVLPFVVSVLKPLACSAADQYDKHSAALLISQLFTILGYGLLLLIPFVINFVPTQLLWYIFCLLAFVANTSMGVGISLTDYLVMNQVNTIKQNGGDSNYGNFRIWGTIGFGVFGILSGIINENSANLPYLLPGLFLFISIELLDIGCVYRFYHIPHKSHSSKPSIVAFETVNYRPPKNENGEFVDMEAQPYLPTTSTLPAKPFLPRLLDNMKEAASTTSATIRTVLRIYYHYPSLIQHTFIVFCFGVLTALHWNFFFWFLEDIRGKDSLLMGLCIFVNSFVGEIPIFLIAHRIIAWVGPVLSLCISLSAFGLRYLCYGYLLHEEHGRYWDVLLIETLQGLTFSLFYTVMTHIAQYYADKCDKILANDSSMLVETDGVAPSLQNITSSRESSIDDEAEGEYESNTGQSKMNSLRSKSGTLPPTRRIMKPSATMQALMSACYEGLGLGVGSLIGGFLIDYFNVGTIWRSAGFFSLGLVAFNLVIELLKFLKKRKVF